MIELTSRFQINEKLVTSKMIHGEAIIINLKNGMYYSLDKTGALGWVLIGGGYSLKESAELLGARFSVSAEQVQVDLVSLVNDLLGENLVLAADGGVATPRVTLDPPTGEPYVTPVLQRYDDMGDVLAMDPPLPQIEIENEISFRPSALGFGVANEARE